MPSHGHELNHGTQLIGELPVSRLLTFWQAIFIGGDPPRSTELQSMRRVAINNGSWATIPSTPTANSLATLRSLLVSRRWMREYCLRKESSNSSWYSRRSLQKRSLRRP